VFALEVNDSLAQKPVNIEGNLVLLGKFTACLFADEAKFLARHSMVFAAARWRNRTGAIGSSTILVIHVDFVLTRREVRFHNATHPGVETLSGRPGRARRYHCFGFPTRDANLQVFLGNLKSLVGYELVQPVFGLITLPPRKDTLRHTANAVLDVRASDSAVISCPLDHTHLHGDWSGCPAREVG
jgi:hypothetical protein